MLQKNNKILGFTLIELLVVIAVIGFISTIAVTMLNSARIKARNAKRNADIVQLINAFEQAADNDGGALPESNCQNCWDCVSSSACIGAASNSALDAKFEPYIKKSSDEGLFRRIAGGYYYSNPCSEVYCTQGIGAYFRWFLEGSFTTSDKACGKGFTFNAPSSICLYKLN